MRALLLLVACAIVGCATVEATGVQDRGNGYYRIVGRSDGDRGVLGQRTRQTAEAHCASAQGSFRIIASSDVQPKIDLGDEDSVQICFRCDTREQTPRLDPRQMYEACGLPYHQSLFGR